VKKKNIKLNELESTGIGPINYVYGDYNNYNEMIDKYDDIRLSVYYRKNWLNNKKINFELNILKKVF